jgi:hypothetical protein
LFTHAYRAIAKESYLNRQKAEFLLSPDVLKKTPGLSEELELSGADLLFLRSAEEFDRAKAEMDKHLVAGDWGRVMTTVIPFSKPPTVVCNFLCTPRFDFEGNYLQDFSNLEDDLSRLMITIIPTISGDFGGFALLSHLDTANSAPRRLIESLTTRADITSSLLWLVFFDAENFAISPIWYESLAADQSATIQEAFSTRHIDPNELRECKLVAESWGPGKPFSM